MKVADLFSTNATDAILQKALQEKVELEFLFHS